jgi:hypothetical protein
LTSLQETRLPLKKQKLNLQITFTPEGKDCACHFFKINIFFQKELRTCYAFLTLNFPALFFLPSTFLTQIQNCVHTNFF